MFGLKRRFFPFESIQNFTVIKIHHFTRVEFVATYFRERRLCEYLCVLRKELQIPVSRLDTEARSYCWTLNLFSSAAKALLGSRRPRGPTRPGAPRRSKPAVARGRQEPGPTADGTRVTAHGSGASEELRNSPRRDRSSRASPWFREGRMDAQAHPPVFAAGRSGFACASPAKGGGRGVWSAECLVAEGRDRALVRQGVGRSRGAGPCAQKEEVRGLHLGRSGTAAGFNTCPASTSGSRRTLRRDQGLSPRALTCKGVEAG